MRPAWYIIVWRLPFWLLFQILRYTTFVVLSIGFGLRAGRRFLGDTE